MNRAKRARRKSWRCFHCDEVFRPRRAAFLHFGSDEYEGKDVPACVDRLRSDEKARMSELREAQHYASQCQESANHMEDPLPGVRPHRGATDEEHGAERTPGGGMGCQLASKADLPRKLFIAFREEWRRLCQRGQPGEGNPRITWTTTTRTRSLLYGRADADLILGKIRRLCERISSSPKTSSTSQTTSSTSLYSGH